MENMSHTELGLKLTSFLFSFCTSSWSQKLCFVTVWCLEQYALFPGREALSLCLYLLFCLVYFYFPFLPVSLKPFPFLSVSSSCLKVWGTCCPLSAPLCAPRDGCPHHPWARLAGTGGRGLLVLAAGNLPGQDRGGVGPICLSHFKPFSSGFILC